MKIKIIANTALKGVGQVREGQTFDETNANIVELRRLIAFGKAIEIPIGNAKADTDTKAKQDSLKSAISKSAPMTTSNTKI